MGRLIKAAIFDLDGTLLDTEEYQWKGWVVPLKSFGHKLSKEVYIKNYAGNSGQLISEQLVEKYGLSVTPEQLLEMKENLLLEWFKEPIKKMHYALEAIEFFREKGILVAICSGGGGEEVELKLKVNQLIEKVNAFSSLSDVEHGRGKPQPDIYLVGAKRLGIEPKYCIAFEDTSPGMNSALNAGMTCLVVPNEYSKTQDFTGNHGRFDNLEKAIEFVKNEYFL